MIAHPEIDPVMFHLGPVAIRWYGMMYALTFLLGWPLLKRRSRRLMPDLSQDQLSDILLWVLMGVVLGGRLGYVLFYQFDYYLSSPLSIFRVWEGGMSFHGGLIGCLVACVVASRRFGKPCLALADLVIPIAPIGLFLGRIGNFINGELWGRPTEVPWGMLFPHAGPLPRHPSQLYEAGLEGVALFVILWWLGRRRHGHGFLLGAFFLFYGLFRFLVEFVREPDAQLGLLAWGLSMGQWLCLPMGLLGVWILWSARSAKP
ncbi:MAG: prolipoprotein diacylglyceryl transferase [Magnetococcales bacterium]|nr:prolipoprotein diacylglyceryl transferase [Magnetococcales bacterium]MBF0155988.1 prolipoprotein diacylglyceryl transferase [Magnetococcales bacterium]